MPERFIKRYGQSSKDKIDDVRSYLEDELSQLDEKKGEYKEAVYHSARAGYLYDLGRDEESIRAYEQAYQIPGNPYKDEHDYHMFKESAFNRIAEMKHDLGRHEEAEEASRIARMSGDHMESIIHANEAAYEARRSLRSSLQSGSTIFGGPGYQQRSPWEGLGNPPYHKGFIHPDTGQPYQPGPINPRTGKPF